MESDLKTVILVSGAIIVFGLIIFFNLFVRTRVFRSYRRLREKNIEMETGQLLWKGRLEHEILPKYPESKAEILRFSRQVRNSIRLIVLLLLLFILIILTIVML